ncbi:MAG: CYTH and CHAD domain-containing protein [Candidatus Dormibacteria bacterium]
MLEREVKLAAGPGFHLPSLQGIAEGLTASAIQSERLSTIYYDTADLRLARWGLSLRHRRGQGWTLKVPQKAEGPVLAREEYEAPGGRGRPPEKLAAIVRAFVRSAPLVPVARLSTLRQRVTLDDVDGRRAAEVVDDDVAVLEGRRVVARFRELEVELGEIEPETVEVLLARLREAGAGAADATPKHVRALGPPAVARPEVFAPSINARATVRDALRASLSEPVASLLHHDVALRTRGEAEDVHQARVATRRLRSHLRTFMPLLQVEWAAKLREELGWIATELGDVRDREVLRDRLRGNLRRLPEADRPVGERIAARLDVEVRAARRVLRTGLDSTRYITLLDSLVDASREPMTTDQGDLPARDVFPRMALRPWRALRNHVRRLPAKPVDEDLHQARILAKRCRYAAEAIAPVAGRGAARFARAATELQTVLGEHQDSVNAQIWLRAQRLSARQAYVAGQLAQLEEEMAQRCRRRWRRAWERLARPGLREWME